MSAISLRGMHSVPRARPAVDSGSIRLTELENKLRILIDDFTQELRQEGQDVECRIAGGWVRDKLLGLESNDIDIALSSMMGFPFAVKFAAFLERRGINVTRVTKVESRAEQSKHLETAKITVLGQELDFVNLRSEEYAEESRIPTNVTFGTPLEDALRRDTTINALFYNLHSRAVEDHTSKGLEDLRQGIIRTPLPPRQTFLDDPLRVIRCIRFASRFGYELIPELANAARDREIQTALEAKIKRERIGDEVDKMMKGPDPLRAIQLIDSLALHHSIFTPPSSAFPQAPVPDTIPHHAALAAATILHHFISSASASHDSVNTVQPVEPALSSEPVAESQSTSPLAPHISPLSAQFPIPHPTLLSHTLVDPSTKRRLFMASALTPFRRLTYQEKKKTKLLVEACIREGLKLGLQNHYVDGIPALFAASDLLLQPRLEKFESPSPRVALGLLLRDKSVHNPMIGTYWTSSLLFSLVQELVSLWDPAEDKFDTNRSIVTRLPDAPVDSARDILELYTTFVQRVEELDLPRSLEDPPRLDGREVCSLLGKKPGQWTGRILNQIMEWQLDQPNGTKAECATWLVGEVKAGKISIETDGAVGQQTAADAHRKKKVKLSKDA